MASVDEVVELPPRPRARFSTAELIELESDLEKESEEPPPSPSRVSASEVLEQVTEKRAQALGQIGGLLEKLVAQVAPARPQTR